MNNYKEEIKAYLEEAKVELFNYDEANSYTKFKFDKQKFYQIKNKYKKEIEEIMQLVGTNKKEELKTKLVEIFYSLENKG